MNPQTIPKADRDWLTIQIPHDLKRQFEEICRTEDRSMSYVVRRLIQDYIANQNKEAQNGD